MCFESCIREGEKNRKENVLILLNYPKTSSDVIELGGLNEGSARETGSG